MLRGASETGQQGRGAPDPRTKPEPAAPQAHPGRPAPDQDFTLESQAFASTVYTDVRTRFVLM